MDTNQNMGVVYEALRKHYLWLGGKPGGERLHVHDDSFADADLRQADLREADFWGAMLRNVDFRDADLRKANFGAACLFNSDCRRAKFDFANLKAADISDVDFRGASFCGAQIDLSAWSLLCGSSYIKIDTHVFRQLVDHLLVVRCDDVEAMEAQRWLRQHVARSFLAAELGIAGDDNQSLDKNKGGKDD